MKKWFETKKPILILAPMADYTDKPFGLICRKYSGRNFVIFKEMVSAEALVRGNIKTLKMCEFVPAERPLIIQIFGDKSKVMAEAAKLVEKRFKPDGIDLNMGCPVPKIAQKGLSGAALMKNPTLVANIVKSVKKAVKLPVSVKTRLGWSNSDEIIKFAVIVEKAGADLITIHGRTKVQSYSGVADWEQIAKVKKILKIPVIANGDIIDKASAKKCLDITKADGIMIGRGALGKPWIFSEITRLQDYKKCHPREGGDPGKLATGFPLGGLPDLLVVRAGGNDKIEDICKIVLEHAKLHEKHYGQGSLVTFRKHLGLYFKGIPHIKDLRTRLMQVKEYGELKKILKNIK